MNEQTNEPVQGLPEAPVFRMTTKVIQFDAPSSSGLPIFKAAMTAALRTLRGQEQFQVDSGNTEEVANIREAMQTVHAVMTGISVAATANLREFDAYQEAMANYQAQQSQYGISFAQQMPPPAQAGEDVA